MIKVNGFRFAEAKCTVEHDRDVVRRNIIALMIDAELADTDNAIAAFDDLVHKEIPQQFRNCLGRISIPYRHLVCILSCYLFLAFDRLGAGLATGLSTNESFRVFDDLFIVGFSILPNACSVMQFIMFC